MDYKIILIEDDEHLPFLSIKYLFNGVVHSTGVGRPGKLEYAETYARYIVERLLVSILHGESDEAVADRLSELRGFCSRYGVVAKDIKYDEFTEIRLTEQITKDSYLVMTRDKLKHVAYTRDMGLELMKVDIDDAKRLFKLVARVRALKDH